MHVRPVTLIVSCVLLATGCGHSPSFTTEDHRPTTPFDAAVPDRLTFNALADRHPAWTPDGRSVMYTFERWVPGEEYPDRCLGALPANGGARTAEWCWNEFGQELRRDGIETGMLLADGRLVFTHLYGAGVKQPTPVFGRLYAARDTLLTDREEMFGLLTRASGATERYDFLRGLVPGPDGFVTTIGTKAVIDAVCTVCDFDTTYIGVDLVRIALDGSGTMEPLAYLPASEFLARDASLDRLFFARHGRIESIAPDGGYPKIVWQAPQSPVRERIRITGLGVGAGRMVVAWRWEQRDSVGAVPVVHSMLARVQSDGDITPLRYETDGSVWGEVSLSPDGRQAVVEWVRFGMPPDLYRFTVP